MKPTRRPGELGMHSLDHFHFVVPTWSSPRIFYDEFGLDVGERGSALSLGTNGHPHDMGHNRRGPRKRHGTCRSAPSRTTSIASPSACRNGVTRLDPPPGVESNGMWFHDHDENLVEIEVAPKTSPDEKSQFRLSLGGPGSAARPIAARSSAHIRAAWRTS